MPAQYPISWYQVAWSSELKPKTIKSVKLCGRSLVVYRVTAHLTVHVQEGRVTALTGFIGRILSYCINSTFAEGIPIWNQKIYREHPVLAKGDEGIPKFRNWYRTFSVAP